MQKLRCLLLLVLLLSLVNCSEDSDEDFHFVTLQITKATLPETFELNQKYEIEIQYIRPDGCTVFEGFDISNPENNERTTNIAAIGITYIDQLCTQAVEEASASFDFEALSTGDYLLRFYSGEDALGNPIYIEYEIPVTE